MHLDDRLAAEPSPPWPDIDSRFLNGGRPPPPAFPLDILPEPWRSWVEHRALSSTGVDFLAQGLLGAVSAVCGARIVVEVTPDWHEPLVLWQALVGAPSTGKTPALQAARRVVESLGADDTALMPALPADSPPLLLARTAYSHPRGVALWCDDLAGWLAGLVDRQERLLALTGWSGQAAHLPGTRQLLARDVPRLVFGITGTLQADRLAEALAGGDAGAASRFLYAWPMPRLEARLGGGSADEGRVPGLVHRLAALPGTVQAPHTLALQEEAATCLETTIPALRGFMRDSDGLEAAWIGKAAGNIARLAGLLCLMDWAQKTGTAPPLAVEGRHVEQAHALWSDYFWPHAQAVFGLAGTTLADRQARRVARWLRRVRAESVSREEIRREALSQSVDADTAEALIERLERYGVLRPSTAQGSHRGGPRKRRWAVHPELLTG
jgi:hypothetical protein